VILNESEREREREKTWPLSLVEQKNSHTHYNNERMCLKWHKEDNDTHIHVSDFDR
jgi:hypothetical protein